MCKIAILVPVCSRNQDYKSVEDIDFLKHLYPSIQSTKEEEYEYHFFLGYDDDDKFYSENKDLLKKEDVYLFELRGCQNSPPNAWNSLFTIAFFSELKFDYFFQIGDDVTLKSKGWTSQFIDILQKNNGIGTVGPCEITNYKQRITRGMPFVLENNFVSRKHYEIFGYFFRPEIKNWYCDDWITRIYEDKAVMNKNIIVENKIRDNRYQIMMINVNEYVEEGKKQIKLFTSP